MPEAIKRGELPTSTDAGKAKPYTRMYWLVGACIVIFAIILGVVFSVQYSKKQKYNAVKNTVPSQFILPGNKPGLVSVKPGEEYALRNDETIDNGLSYSENKNFKETLEAVFMTYFGKGWAILPGSKKLPAGNMYKLGNTTQSIFIKIEYGPNGSSSAPTLVTIVPVQKINK